jgi:hypothetical protein
VGTLERRVGTLESKVDALAIKVDAGQDENRAAFQKLFARLEAAGTFAKRKRRKRGTSAARSKGPSRMT